MADENRGEDRRSRTDHPQRERDTDRKPTDDAKPGKTPKDTEGPMGDHALTEESAKDPDVDRSKTPGRDYDV